MQQARLRAIPFALQRSPTLTSRDIPSDSNSCITLATGPPVTPPFPPFPHSALRGRENGNKPCDGQYNDSSAHSDDSGAAPMGESVNV